MSTIQTASAQLIKSLILAAQLLEAHQRASKALGHPRFMDAKGHMSTAMAGALREVREAMDEWEKHNL